MFGSLHFFAGFTYPPCTPAQKVITWVAYGLLVISLIVCVFVGIKAWKKALHWLPKEVSIRRFLYELIVFPAIFLLTLTAIGVSWLVISLFVPSCR